MMRFNDLRETLQLQVAGKTAAVVTLESSQVRPVAEREIAHARELAPA